MVMNKWTEWLDEGFPVDAVYLDFSKAFDSMLHEWLLLTIHAYHGKIDDNWQDADEVKTHYLKNAIKELLTGEEVSIPETFSIGCTIKWK